MQWVLSHHKESFTRNLLQRLFYWLTLYFHCLIELHALSSYIYIHPWWYYLCCVKWCVFSHMWSLHVRKWSHIIIKVRIINQVTELAGSRTSLIPRLSNYCGGGKESLVSIAYACANCPGILGRQYTTVIFRLMYVWQCHQDLFSTDAGYLLIKLQLFFTDSSWYSHCQ